MQDRKPTIKMIVGFLMFLSKENTVNIDMTEGKLER